MEIITVLAIIAGAILFIVLFARRFRKKDMYVKREHHIQAFPPGHRNPRR